MPHTLALVSTFLVACSVGSSTPAAPSVLVEWRFDQAKNLRGWQPNSHLTEVQVRDGALSARAVGNDPLLMGPVFEIPARPNQRVEIRMKSTAAAPMQLFWTETLQGKFGGFGEGKVRNFQSIGDDAWHVYHVYPFWHPKKKILRLRLDPPSAGRFALEWIRVVEEPPPATTAATQWTAETFPSQWRPCEDVAVQGSNPLWLSPPLSIDAEENAFVCIRLASHQVGSGRLYCVSQDKVGWESVPFALRPDGQVHSYNVDVSGLKNWQGRMVLLGLQLPQEALSGVRSVAVSRDPGGPAELEIAYFGATDGINRIGHPVSVSLSVKNLGGDLAQQVCAALEVPAGVKVLDEPRKTLERLSLYVPKTFSWKVAADGPGPIQLGVKVTASGISPKTARAAIPLTPAPGVPSTGYVPEPKPVACKYDLGVFYFPGWSTAARWKPIRDWPNRKPILGWYDEANPECADWQIKWAVEHGVKFFMVDWYWVKGARHLEHWVHQAYAKARYRKYLQWAVMWANHNPPGTHSLEDWRAVTRYWIENYFGMPEYYRIDGRPAVFIWSPSGVRNDLGGSAAAAKLYALSQEMARAAGYRGIYFVAMSSHDTAERAAQLKSEGYEGLTSYHGFNLARKLTGSDLFPFSKVVETAQETWQDVDARAAGMCYMPIVDTGWDARPWHGEKTMVASGRTPELFGQLCRQARQYADAHQKKIIAIGPWNEWGEGSYIEPYAEYGFADLDQLRAAFCEPANWPPNLVPADVGRGPYDLPDYVAKNAWEFNTDGDLEGWSPSGQVSKLEARGGVLVGLSSGSDPVLSMPGLQVEADRTRIVRFRFRTDAKGQVQIFWATPVVKMSGRTCITLDVPGDNQFHEYTVDLSKNRLWRGVVTQLRFDPAVKPGVRFELDWLRLE